LDKEQRAQHARTLLNDPLMEEAFSELEETYISAWRKAGTVEAREDAHRYVTLIGKVKEHLSQQLMGGEMAARDRRELEGRRGLSSIVGSWRP